RRFFGYGRQGGNALGVEDDLRYVFNGIFGRDENGRVAGAGGEVLGDDALAIPGLRFPEYELTLRHSAGAQANQAEASQEQNCGRSDPGAARVGGYELSNARPQSGCVFAPDGRMGRSKFWTAGPKCRSSGT